MGINYAVLGINWYKMSLILPRATVLRRSKCYTWKTDVQQRAHWLVVCYSSCRSYRKYFVAEQCVHCTLLHYDMGGMKWILLTIFIKPFVYERFLDWHNTRFNNLTHIFFFFFFRLVGRLLLTCKNIMSHVKILEHISSSNIPKFLVKIWSGLKEWL